MPLLDPDGEMAARIARLEQRQAPDSVTDWFREKPIRRGRLLVWFVDRFSTDDGMDEVFTAMASAINLMDTPEGRRVIDEWRAANERAAALGLQVES